MAQPVPWVGAAERSVAVFPRGASSGWNCGLLTSCHDDGGDDGGGDGAGVSVSASDYVHVHVSPCRSSLDIIIHSGLKTATTTYK